MTCATCQQYRAHKARKGIGFCRLMTPRRIGEAAQPSIIASDQACYFSVPKWVQKAGVAIK